MTQTTNTQIDRIIKRTDEITEKELARQELPNPRTQTNTTQNKEELELKSPPLFERYPDPLASLKRIIKDDLEYMTSDRKLALSLLNLVISQAHQSGIEEGARKEREKIKWAWTKLNIVAGASAGSAQGLIARNPWGETDAMQVDREAYKEFIESLKGNKQ